MTKIPEDSISIRAYKSDVDKNFIYSTWLQNYKYSSYFAKRIKPHVFFTGHQKIIDHLIAKPIKVLIACPKNDDETICGYIAYEFKNDKPILHFIFIKEAFREMGIAKNLLKAAKIETPTFTFTHWTFPIDELVRVHPDLTYDPYQL